jgi:hypothetical protein
VKEAPLFVDAYDLAVDLCRRLQQPGGSELPCQVVLSQRVVTAAMDLVDRVTLALKGYERDRCVAEADECLALLRVYLRMTMDLGLIERQQHLAFIEQLDAIGRQLGGWQKSLREV